MKYRPGHLVEILKSLDEHSKAGKVIYPIPTRYIGKLGIVMSFTEEFSTYQVLVDVEDDVLDVYEEEIGLI
jgi:hypothetical protein